ncbi:MAG: dihydroorotase [Candidatus Omnitrophota bacterium]
MTPSTYLIRSGRVIDPVNKFDGVADILISGGKIVKIGAGLGEKCDKVIDAKGKIVIPGLVDMHTHLREPGREDKETIASGTRAAVRGGYTTVACMPNTDPAIDSPKAVKLVEEIIKRDALCGVAVVGAITLSRAGKKLSDLAGMKRAGAAAVSDDGSPVEDKKLMLEALKCAGAAGLVVIDHCEDIGLSASGVINKGYVSTKMGLKGIARAAEYEIVGRDIGIAEKCGARIHIAHVSCAESVDIIRKAKKRGVKVTAETAPHYFTLTEECCVTYDTNTKMNPPLRSKDDVEAVKKGLADGTIDAIATDHAPHTDAEKDVEFDFAPFGIIGLETALSLSVSELVGPGLLSWNTLIEKMSLNPARILGLGAPGLKKGAPADIAIIDPAKEYTYTKESVESKSKNSPFIGWSLKGKVTELFVRGELVMEGESIRARR